MDKGDIYFIEEFGENWEIINFGVFPTGEEYVDFKVVSGPEDEYYITHNKKKEFTKGNFQRIYKKHEETH